MELGSHYANRTLMGVCLLKVSYINIYSICMNKRTLVIIDIQPISTYKTLKVIYKHFRP